MYACSFNNTFIQESTSSYLLTKTLYVELLKKEMFMSFFKLIFSLFKTWTTINVVRNARCARFRFTLKLSPFLINQWMNQLINRVYIERLICRQETKLYTDTYIALQYLYFNQILQYCMHCTLLEPSRMHKDQIGLKCYFNAKIMIIQFKFTKGFKF